MKTTRFAGIALYLAVSAGCLGIAVPSAAAQSCAMCYQNAAATGTTGRIALQRGILILAVPAISLFAGILLLLYTRRNLGDRSRGLAHEWSEAVLHERFLVRKE
jgi:hypothetical protein